MRRKRRRHANWPFRLTLLGLGAAVLSYIAVRTVIANQWQHMDWTLALVASCFDATVAAFFFVVGACIGSFLNVVVYRIPLGRSIGGHSSCPYCATPIESSDNVPVLAWIKLRGRCRTCRLPISAQYPLVEFSVACVFLFVCFTELATGGGNLPDTQGLSQHGMLRDALTARAMLQLFVYLFALSSLIAAALIVLKRLRLPLSLYAWAVAPLVAVGLAWPDVLVLAWRDAKAVGPVDARLHASVTLLCGAVAGAAIARLLTPLAYRSADPKLLSNDPDSVRARQFIGAMCVAGMLVGWQSAVSMAWTIVLSALLAGAALRWFASARNDADATHRPANSVHTQDGARSGDGDYSVDLLNLDEADNSDGREKADSSRGAKEPALAESVPSAAGWLDLSRVNVSDLTVWVWLGLMIFRGFWQPLLELQILPTALPVVLRHVLAALLLAPVVQLLSSPAKGSNVPS